MSKDKLKEEFTKYLNELYSEIYNPDDAWELLQYLNNGRIRKSTVLKHHNNRTLGNLFRQHDPVGFNVAFSEWKQERWPEWKRL